MAGMHTQSHASHHETARNAMTTLLVAMGASYVCHAEHGGGPKNPRITTQHASKMCIGGAAGGVRASDTVPMRRIPMLDLDTLRCGRGRALRACVSTSGASLTHLLHAYTPHHLAPILPVSLLLHTS